MHALDILGHPVRRRLVELLAEGDRTAGELTSVISAEFGITQPAVSNHLRVLRESGFARAQREGSRQRYVVVPDRVDEVGHWLQRYRRRWTGALDALDTELRRGARGHPAPTPPATDTGALTQTDSAPADPTRPSPAQEDAP